MANCNNIVNNLLNLNLNIIDKKKNRYNFEHFITDSKVDITELLDKKSDIYGFVIEISLIEKWKLEENSISCTKISDDELSIDFKVIVDVEGHVGEFSLGLGKLNIKIDMIYDVGSNLITSITIESANISEPFEPKEVYDAECSFHAKFIK